MSRLNSFRGSRSLLLPQLPLTYARRQRQLLSHVKYLKKERSFGALMVLLPDYLAKAITDWSVENIPDFHLAKGGRETRPHVTVRYGFPDSSEETVQELRSYLQGTSPARITLKSLSTFPEGDDGVPLIVLVESPELERLNAELGMMFDCEETHPKYIAHVTLAYLRPEVAESYLKAKPPFLPTTTTVDRLEWSGADARTELIELSILPQFGVKALEQWKNNQGHADARRVKGDNVKSLPYRVKRSPFVGRKFLPGQYTKSEGQPCQQGETAARSGCIPASGEGGKQPTEKPDQKKTKQTSELKEATNAYERAVDFLRHTDPDSPEYEKIKSDVSKAAGRVLRERAKLRAKKSEAKPEPKPEAVPERSSETPKRKTFKERAAAIKQRAKQIKDRIKEGGKKAAETAGKAVVSTRGFFRGLTEKYLGKAGAETADAVLSAVQDTINEIILGRDELPEDPAGWAVNIATGMIPDIVAWSYRMARWKLTGKDPRKLPPGSPWFDSTDEKSLHSPEEVDLDGIADMIVDLQQEYLNDGMDFEPMDKEGVLQMLKGGLEDYPGSRGEKSLTYFIKMEEHRDRGGRRYCTEKGEGIVPCGEQKTTEEGDTPGSKPSPAPATGQPRKLGGESSRSYQQEAQRSQRREQRRETRNAEKENKRTQSGMPSLQSSQNDLREELNEGDEIDQEITKGGVRKIAKEVLGKIKEATSKVHDEVGKKAVAVRMYVDEMEEKLAKKLGWDEGKRKKWKEAAEKDLSKRLEDFGKSGDRDTIDSIDDLFTLKNLIKIAPEAVVIMVKLSKIITKPMRERAEARKEAQRQLRRRQKGKRKKHKMERQSGRGGKSLSWLDNSRGGAIVPPPEQGKRIPLSRSPFKGRKLLIGNRIKSRDHEAREFAKLLSAMGEKSHPIARFPEDEDPQQIGFALSEARGQLAAILNQYGTNDLFGLRNILDPRAWHRVEMALQSVERLEEQYAEARERNILVRGKSMIGHKSGFTGKKPDKLGRQYCYENGKRVPCPKKDGEKPEKATHEGVEGGRVSVGEDTKPKGDDSVQSLDKLRSQLDKVNDRLSGRSGKPPRPGTVAHRQLEEKYHDLTDKIQKITESSGESTSQPAKPERREPTPEEVRAVHNPETGRKSAVDAIRDVNGGSMYGRIMDDKQITDSELERASEKVHDAWMQREASLPGGGRESRRHLMVPYDRLSEEDKEKDRAFVREVVASMRPAKYWGSKEQPFYRPGPNPTVDNVVMRDGESGPEVLLIRRKEGGLSDKLKQEMTDQLRRKFPAALTGQEGAKNPVLPNAESLDFSENKNGSDISRKLEAALKNGKENGVVVQLPKDNGRLLRDFSWELRQLMEQYPETKLILQSDDDRADKLLMYNGDLSGRVRTFKSDKTNVVEGGKWALPGGFIDSDSTKGEPFKPGKETPQQAALRELTEESGLDLESIKDQVKPVGTFDTRGRDPRDNAEAWAVSEAFSVKLPPDMANSYVEGRDDADRAEWVPVSEIKNRDIAFDHRDILKASGVGPENVDPGFTGTDSLGREWRDGELVAKQEEQPQAEKLPTSGRVTDPVRQLNPDNVDDVWRQIKAEIEKHDPKLSPNMAGEIAAARIVNAYSDSAIKFRDEMDRRVTAKEPISNDEDMLYGELDDLRGNIARKLEKLSGIRAWTNISDNPLAKLPLDAPLEDRQSPREVTNQENRRRADEVHRSRTESAATRKAESQRRAEEHARREKESSDRQWEDARRRNEKFTGIDPLGREWRDGELVAKQEEQPQTEKLPTEDEFIDWNESRSSSDLEKLVQISERYENRKLSRGGAVNEIVAAIPGTTRAMATEWVRQNDLMNDLTPEEGIPSETPTAEEYTDWMESASVNDIGTRSHIAEQYQQGELSFDDAAEELTRRVPFTDLRMAQEYLRQMDESTRPAPKREAPKQRPVKMERVTADNEKMKQAVLDAGKHWAREFGIFDFGEQRYADAMKRDAQTGYSRFATSPDGEYVGHMLAHPMGDLNELAGERGYTEQTPYVRNIMAAPNARKTGAARQLLNDFADRILKDPNLPDTEKRVVLDTPITNQQAVEYYDKLGFDRAGTFKYGDNEFYRFEIPAQKLKENTKPREAKQEAPTASETLTVSEDVHKEIKRQFDSIGFPALVTNVPDGASVGYPGAHEVDLSSAETRSDVIQSLRDAVDDAGPDGVLSINLPKSEEARLQLARAIKNLAEDGIKVIVHSPDQSADELPMLNRDLMGRSRVIKAGPDKPKVSPKKKPRIKPSPFKGRKKPI